MRKKEKEQQTPLTQVHKNKNLFLIANQNLAGNTKPRNSEQKINVIPSLQDSYFLVPRIKSDDEEYINHSIKVNHSIKDAQKGGFLEALKQLSDEIHRSE